MPFEVWYVPFEAGAHSASFKGEAEGYCNTKPHTKTSKSTGLEVVTTRVFVQRQKSPMLKTYDRSDTKLIILAHCFKDGVVLMAEEMDGRAETISYQELAKLLYDTENIRNIKNIQIYACHSASATGSTDGKFSFAYSFADCLMEKMESLDKVSGFQSKTSRPDLQHGSKMAQDPNNVKSMVPAHTVKRTFTRNEIVPVIGDD